MKLRFAKLSMQGMLVITNKVFGTRDNRIDRHRSYSTAMLVWLSLLGLYTEREDRGRVHNVPHQTLS